MNPPVVTVRTSGRANLPAVTEVWTTAGGQAVPGRELRKALEHGPGLLPVAEAPGGWIHRLAISPDHRRTGPASWQRLGHVSCPDGLRWKPLHDAVPTVPR